MAGFVAMMFLEVRLDRRGTRLFRSSAACGMLAMRICLLE
jgi:hypothetical protein